MKLPLRTANYTITLTIASGIIYFVAIPIAKKYMTPESILFFKMKFDGLVTFIRFKSLLGEVPPVKDKDFYSISLGNLIPDDIQDKIPESLLETKISINHPILATTFDFYSKNRQLVNSGATTIGSLIVSHYLKSNNLSPYPDDPVLAKDIIKEVQRLKKNS